MRTPRRTLSRLILAAALSSLPIRAAADYSPPPEAQAAFDKKIAENLAQPCKSVAKDFTDDFRPIVALFEGQGPADPQTVFVADLVLKTVGDHLAAKCISACPQQEQDQFKTAMNKTRTGVTNLEAISAATKQACVQDLETARKMLLSSCVGEAASAAPAAQPAPSPAPAPAPQPAPAAKHPAADMFKAGTDIPPDAQPGDKLVAAARDAQRRQPGETDDAYKARVASAAGNLGFDKAQVAAVVDLYLKKNPPAPQPPAAPEVPAAPTPPVQEASERVRAALKAALLSGSPVPADVLKESGKLGEVVRRGQTCAEKGDARTACLNRLSGAAARLGVTDPAELNKVLFSGIYQKQWNGGAPPPPPAPAAAPPVPAPAGPAPVPAPPAAVAPAPSPAPSAPSVPAPVPAPSVPAPVPAPSVPVAPPAAVSKPGKPQTPAGGTLPSPAKAPPPPPAPGAAPAAARPAQDDSALGVAGRARVGVAVTSIYACAKAEEIEKGGRRDVNYWKPLCDVSWAMNGLFSESAPAKK